MMAEELKTLDDAAQICGSETRPVEGHTYLLFHVSSFTETHVEMHLFKRER